MRHRACLFAVVLAGGGCHGVLFNGDNAGAVDLGASRGADGPLGPPPTLASISLSPASAMLELLNGAVSNQPFTATAHYSDGSTMTLGPGVAWTVDFPQIGGIDGSGVYRPSGTVGGIVHVTASYQQKTGKAQLTIKLHTTSNPANLSAAAQSALTGATTADAAVTWAYPYDGTVFPRGLGAPLLMWNGGASTDNYYVHLLSPTYEFESFTTATAAGQIALDSGTWEQFVDSTAGSASLTVARLDANNNATIISKLNWTIAPAALRGTVYYWANNLGRVERIKPGAGAPDDFANQPPLSDPNQYPKQSSCLMTCHTVSADGSTLVSGGGTFGGSYDLKAGMPMTSLGGVWGWNNESDWQNIRWMTPALSPDGKYIATNAVALELSVNSGGPADFGGLYQTADGSLVPNSGLDAIAPYMPAWSPDGKSIAYLADSYSPGASWEAPTPGTLNIVDFNLANSPMAQNARTLIQPGNDPNLGFIAWPSFSPDSRWIVYQRGVSLDTRNGHSDLYLADSQNPGVEVRLAKLDGDGYPFAAGARDLSLNFEPTFAPVASGGYFWVVFTSRRTFGNLLTGDSTTVKQLWIAAIDQSPSGGAMPADPSHPPFLLPGQNNGSLNMRGFFALPPCKSDGQSCTSGTDCCGGYCDSSGGSPVCSSMQSSCSQDGDHCNQDSDCCGAVNGVTCINHVCSEPPPVQ